MNIRQATQQYEAWLASHIRVLKADLDFKHTMMARDAFAFLRATFYRWMQLFPEKCPGVADAPSLLAVGDLHVENFGTWRDSEGRLVWGINDFDEAFPLPYTIDLVRLAASALLAIQIGDLSIVPADVCAAITEGYAKGLENGGEPFVLAEKHPLLRKALSGETRQPDLFWEKLDALPSATPVPAKVMRMYKKIMPAPRLPFRVAHRRAGMGSLGRERFTAIAEWRGGRIAREVKPLLPSACAWARGLSSGTIYYHRILTISVRAPDPFLVVLDGWVTRRLSPYCNRIELSQMPKSHDEVKLLHAMGKEIANVHLGSRRAIASVRADLRKRKSKWLAAAANIMADATMADWKEWSRG